MRFILKGTLPVCRMAFQLAAVAGLAAPAQGFAQIKTDGSVGPAQNLAGPRYQIGENLGRRAGANVFHSFQTFNLNAGESAAFTTSAPTSNVISRVTGGTPSQINGQISLIASSGAPNFYFINPAGVTFGAGASIDVPGAFHVATADYVKFADGKFNADLKSTSSFSASAPEAFGFLGNGRAALGVNQGALLATKPRQSLTLAGGDVLMDQGVAQTSAGGNIRIAAAGRQAVDIPFEGRLPALSGNLTLTDGGAITANTGPIGDVGDIAVGAGSILIEGRGSDKTTGITSSAGAGTTGKAGDIDIAASSLTVSKGGVIASNTFASGDSGSVRVNADAILIDGQGVATRITAAALPGSTGNAGSVEVNARSSLAINGGANIEASTLASGNAGSVTVRAGSMVIDGQSKASGVSGAAMSGSTGNAGNVDITVAGDLVLANGGAIASPTFAAGNAGAVRVSAGNIAIRSVAGSALTGITTSAESESTGNGGIVSVTAAGNLSLDGGAQISSSARSRGDAGNVRVAAGRDITISNGASIESPAIRSGNAGNLEVSAGGRLALLAGGQINSSTIGSGRAGEIDARASDIVVSGGSGGRNSVISASASGASTGQTGNVTLSAQTITVSNGGNLAIQNGATAADPTALTPTLLRLEADSVSIDGGQVTAASTGNVAASNIAIRYGSRLSVSRGSITSSSNEGDAGSVRIEGGKVLSLQNAQVSTSVASARTGNGGDIDIRSETLVMQTGFIQANTTASRASGGNVRIDVQSLVPSLGSLLLGGSTALDFAPGVPGFNVIQAAAPTGLSGNVAISSPVLNISATLAALKYQVLDTGGLARSPCQTTRGSSLSLPGRGALPPSGSGLLGMTPATDAAPARLKCPGG